MLQQGGQISDSFGGPLSLLTLLKEELLGIRDASESSEESLSDTANALAENARNAGELGRFMSVARVAAGGGVAVLAALAAAAWQAEQADRALLRSLILTGGAAATTTAELWKMAGVISDEAGGGIRQAAENLARLAESGKYTAGQLRIMGETSQRWLQTVGDDAGKVEKAFEGIAADPVAGMKSGWGEWAESATDSFSQVKSAATQTFDGIAQNMAAMLTGSEQNWRGFTRSVLSMLTEIFLKQAMVGIVGSIGSAIGGAVGGGASASGGTAIQAAAANFHFATGGFTGTGGKYEPAGIVHRGEFVFTKEATSRIGVGNLY